MENELSRIQPPMVKILPEAGFDANNRVPERTTPCPSLLRFFWGNNQQNRNFPTMYSGSESTMVDIFKFYLLFGANVNAYRCGLGRDQSLWNLFRACFGHLLSAPVLDIKRLIEGKEVQGDQNSRENESPPPWNYLYSSTAYLIRNETVKNESRYIRGESGSRFIPVAYGTTNRRRNYYRPR